MSCRVRQEITIAHWCFIDFRSENNDTKPQESNGKTVSNPKCTQGRPRKLPHRQRKMNAESSQWRPMTPMKSYGRVVVHEKSKKIRIISPAPPVDDGSSQLAENDVTKDSTKPPEVWLRDAAEHMRNAAISGNLVMTQQVCLISYFIDCLFTHCWTS